jgi:hypothetical protein
VEAGHVQVELAGLKLSFNTDSVGGEIKWRGPSAQLAETVQFNN